MGAGFYIYDAADRLSTELEPTTGRTWWGDKFEQRFNIPETRAQAGACQKQAYTSDQIGLLGMTSLIERLWLANNLPIKDGLYRADGAAYGVQVDASVEGGLRVLASFSLEEFLSQDPEWITWIDTTLEEQLPHGVGYLCCGEGSYGSEGFFGRLDQHKNLVWVVYIENSNPFVHISIGNSTATFISSEGVSITVDLRTLEFGAR